MKTQNNSRAKAKFDPRTLDIIAPGRKKYFENDPHRAQNMLKEVMKMIMERAVLTVRRHQGEWAVELDGELFGRSPDREVAKAAANRRAREIQEGGRACQVRVTGETGFYAAS